MSPPLEKLALPLLFLTACAAAPASIPSPATHKPVATLDRVAEAKPKLAEWVEKTLPGKKLGETTVGKARLVDARLFEEGYVHETWRLDVEIDGVTRPMALKLFPTAEQAAANEAQYRLARAKGWPIPSEFLRSPVAPYHESPGILREYVPERSLAAHVRSLFKDGRVPNVLDVASAYAEVGRALGTLHEKSRKLQKEGRDDGARLKALAARCADEGWCGAPTRLRLETLAAKLDSSEVSFIHGDLYEEQVILDANGRLTVFIDLDHAHFGDPAADLGALLAHILLVGPAARAAHWGIPAPTQEETKAVANRLLAAYREAAFISGDAWAGFLERAQAYMWLRLGVVLERYRGNVHAQPLWTALEGKKRELIDGDPFATYGLTQ